MIQGEISLLNTKAIVADTQMLAFFPLGFAGMIPLSIMSSMLKTSEGEKEATMLSKLFQPREVKNTVAEIDAFLDQNAASCRNIIRADAVRLANTKDKTVHYIRSDGLKPDQLALILIIYVLGRHLSSGQHHTYRGVLGIIGSDMFKLWKSAVTAMQERGYYSSEDAQEGMRWIQSEIKNVG